jgi:fatty acid desaturase
MEATFPDDPTHSADPATRQVLAFFKKSGNERLFEEFCRLHQISDIRAAWSIARQWLVIGAAVALAVNTGKLWAYAVAIVVVSTRQHALGIVMHEATHFRLFSKRWANEFFGDILCAFPVNMTVSRYRYEHLLHHRHNMTDQDPYFVAWSRDSHWYWPKTRAEAFWLFARDLFSLNMYRLGPALFQWSPWVNHFSTKPSPPGLSALERGRLYAFLLVLVGTLSYFHAWFQFAVLWLLPMSTLTVLFVRIRSVTEHLHLPLENEFNSTRHVQGHPLEKLTIAPLNINIHIAHHLFPSIPQYNLVSVHSLLLKCPAYRDSGTIFDSYFLDGKRAYRDLVT